MAEISSPREWDTIQKILEIVRNAYCALRHMLPYAGHEACEVARSEVIEMAGSDVLRVAKRFCELSGWTLTNLQLQKLIYLSHMVFYGQEGAPLVRGSFEAWDYGPVHPELYHYVKAFGDKPVMNVFKYLGEIKDEKKRKIIDDAYRALGELPTWKLVDITHKPDGAWATNYRKGNRNNVISDEDILREYATYGGGE